jgi:hypothetical protein
MGIKFSAPPVDARDLGAPNGAQVNRKEIGEMLQAHPGAWAKVYGSDTDAPDGAIRSTIAEWKKAGFQVKIVEMETQTNPNNKRFHTWIRWPEGIDVQVANQAATQQAAPLIGPGSTASDAETPPAPVAPPPPPVVQSPVQPVSVPAEHPAATNQTAFQKTYEGVDLGEVQSEPLL